MIATTVPTGDRPRRRILVVEDDPAVLDLVITRLEIAGYETRRAGDGLAAMNRLDEVRPAAVILDLNLPKLDGFGILDLMAHRADLSSIPVLVLSARSNAKDIKLAMALGASDYLTKPFETSRLLSRVARLLLSRRPAAPPASSSLPDDDEPFLV